MRKMKDSGIEWIGEIPEGWEVIRLKYLADFEPTCDTSYLTDESKITYTPMECVKNGGFENRSALYGNLSHTLTPFQNGDIAMAKVTPCFENGNIAIMNNLFSGFGLGSSELFIFRPKSISTRYFFYWLQNKAFVARACSTMTGTGGLKRISPSFIRNCPVHYPSTDEQTKISDYLDAKCSDIDVILSKTRSSIEEYKKLKQAVITQAVTKGVRGEREMKDSRVEWIGEIPAEWSVQRIKTIFSIRNERNYLPLEQVNLISLYTDKGVVQHCDIEKTTGNKASNADGYKKVYPNDMIVNIILCWMGAIGRSNYAGVTSPAYDVYVPSSKIECKFYHYYFRTLGFSGDCYKNGRGIMAMRWRTYSDQFRSIKVVVPPLEEQKEIVGYLDAKCAEIDGLIAKKEQLIKELESYKKSLIYEVVTGKREV